MQGAPGAAAHLGIELGEYDGRIRTFIPGYETLLTVAAETLATTVRARRPIVVDLGIGTGALSAVCLARVPGARIVGVDEDAGILDAARQRLGTALSAAVHDSFERAALPRSDAVVASLSLHHIPTRARRLRVFRRIRAALGRGGVMISADCHPPSDRRLATAARTAWLAHLERVYTPAESRRYLRTWAREDHYATLDDEIATLQRAGFDVDVMYRLGTFAVLAATARG